MDNNLSTLSHRSTGDRSAEQVACIKVERGATGETRFFDTAAEAHRFIMRRGDASELWSVR